MKHHFDPGKDDVPPFDDAAQEREWLAQENAMRLQRSNLDPTSDHEAGRRYRPIVQALREPLPDGLPADFAMRLAARVDALPSARFEYALMIALVVALTITAGVIIVIYGSQWTPSLSAILPARNTQASVWMMALAICLGASWLMERWQRHGHR
jgi:hypothetical protein